MNGNFLIYCDRLFHEGERVTVRSYDLAIEQGQRVGVHPLGKDSSGNRVDVLLVDNMPVRRNFSDERLETFVEQSRARVRHELNCDCGLKVVMQNDRFIEIVQKLFVNGVFEMSLTSLSKYVSI